MNACCVVFCAALWVPVACVGATRAVPDDVTPAPDVAPGGGCVLDPTHGCVAVRANTLCCSTSAARYDDVRGCLVTLGATGALWCTEHPNASAAGGCERIPVTGGCYTRSVDGGRETLLIDAWLTPVEMTARGVGACDGALEQRVLRASACAP